MPLNICVRRTRYFFGKLFNNGCTITSNPGDLFLGNYLIAFLTFGRINGKI